jgi:hypothetical protein
MKHFIYLLIFIAFIPSISAQTNDSYIRKGSLGKRITQEETISTDAFTFRPFSKWIGERFIFLPRSKGIQHYGYQNFDVSYEKYVGRIAKVISIEDDEVTLKMEDNGKELKATAYMETVEGIAPVSDIDSARSRWLNKTLWYKKNEIVLYDEDKDKFSSINISKCSPIKVIDIVAGWHYDSPVRFIIQAHEGDEGFVDLNLSGTNVSVNLQKYNHFEDNFYTEDPRKKFNWSEEVWTSIQSGKVFIGMIAEQAILSWGKPKEINRTNTPGSNSEQWVYTQGNYLYFENGIVKSIQN